MDHVATHHVATHHGETFPSGVGGSRPLVVLAVALSVGAMWGCDGSLSIERSSDQPDGGPPSVEDSGSTGPRDAGPPPMPERSWREPVAATTFHIGFNVVNGYAPGFGSCFGAPLNQLVHAGEDRGAAAGTPVLAVGQGEVVYAANANYPGYVVVIRHDLRADEQAQLGIDTAAIYSQYGHRGAAAVTAGQQVTAGDVVGNVLDQGGNSHLHWEMRRLEVPELCGHNAPGPGYTGPGTDARDYGYLDPTGTIQALD